MARQVDKSLLAAGRAQEGDLVVIVAGSPPGIPGSTNALRVHKMGDAINKVAPAYEDLERLTALAARYGRWRGAMPCALVCCSRTVRRPAQAGSRRSGGMADTEHSKCSARKGVRVQVPPSAPM